MPMNDLVYDVGMNNGDDTAYYLSLGFRVIAIEANPELVAKAKFRFLHEIASGRLIIISVGVADREGLLPFWINDTHSRWSSFHRDCASWGNSPTHEIKVPALRFETILEKYGVPHFCKIDIQGNDFLCLRGFRHAVGYSQFKCISQYTFLPIQLPPVPEQTKVERASALLQSRRFRHRVFRECGGRKWLQDHLERTRNQNGWIFPPQSSGPFGDRTLGRWLNYDEMKRTYREFLHRRDAGETSIFWTDQTLQSFWADFHAKCVEDREAPSIQHEPELDEVWQLSLAKVSGTVPSPRRAVL